MQRRMDEALDGDYQNYKANDGAFVRKDFFGADPKLAEMVSDLTDDEIWKLNRGGHDPFKVYAAYHAAVNHEGQPTVILAKTIKGYGTGTGEAQNIAHNVKKVDLESLKGFRDRFDIPVTDENIGSGNREVSTTMVFVRILAQLLKDKDLGSRIVPIVPDEARTFGMEGMFRQLGIYSAVGQLYQPVDHGQVMYYKEDVKGQILEEGITEAGAMSAWIAAATAYSNHNQPMLPFYAFYSMFGFQRIGDLAWAAGDIRARGFLMGGTAGRTTLNGEGLQHQDGHSHILAGTIPNCHSYDPAYGYEMAVIIREGIYQMLELQNDRYYYITMMNESYAQPAMPEREGIEDDIIRGMYLLEEDKRSSDLHVQLLGSGTILLEVREAAKILRDDFGVGADVWSVTSFNELRRDCLDAERWNRLHPRETTRLSHIENCLQDRRGPVIASTDYMKLYADQVRQWVPQEQYKVLGTDGFGRSDSRKKLRHFFEVDRHWVVLAALEGLVAQGQLDVQVMIDAMDKFGIDANKPNPLDC